MTRTFIWLCVFMALLGGGFAAIGIFVHLRFEQPFLQRGRLPYSAVTIFAPRRFPPPWIAIDEAQGAFVMTLLCACYQLLANY